jgi:hypothetical protein
MPRRVGLLKTHTEESVVRETEDALAYSAGIAWKTTLVTHD